MPIPVLAEPGSFSAIYRDANISLRYPNNWVLTQVSATHAAIFPEGAFLQGIPGHSKYYSHGFFIGTYNPWVAKGKYSFPTANEEMVASIVQSNMGSQISNDKPLSLALSGHDTIVTIIKNPTSPIGHEVIFNFSINLGDRLETIQFFWPESDQTKYHSIMLNIVRSLIVSESTATADQSKAQTPVIAKAKSIALTPQEIAKRASASTLLIVSADRNGKKLALGSGFAIGPDLIVTNSHVLAQGRIGIVRTLNSDQFLDVTVVSRDIKDDLVLLHVPNLKMAPLPLNVNEPVIGDTVFAMGNPEGMEGTFSEGLVSALRNRNDSHLIQITAPISHGSSGGPVLNTYGEVIGISTSMLVSGQNLNFAVPASAISVLLKESR